MNNGLLRATWQYYWRQPLQALLALFGIALGVAAISAMDSVYEQASLSHERGLSGLYGPARHEITAADGTGLDEQVYVRLRREWGALAASPLLRGPLQVDRYSLELVGVDPFALNALGVDPQADGEGDDQARNRFDISALLQNPRAVAMGADMAQRLNLAVGDTFDANIAGRQQTLELGLVWPSVGWAEGWVLTDIAQAQVWLKRQGLLDQILLTEDNPERLQAITDLLADGVLLRAVDDRRAVQRMSQAFYTNLRAMGLLAWLLGIFLAYNAYALMSRQRWREFAHWRTLGVTPAELLRMLVFDATILGLIGGLLGVWMGRYLAALLLPAVTSIGAAFYDGAIASSIVPPTAWFKAGLGPLAAWAALLPLALAIYRLRAAQLARDLDEPQQQRSKAKIAALIGLLSIVAAMILRQQLAWGGVDSVHLGFTVLFLLFVGYALLVPWSTRWVLQVLPLGERLSAALLRQHLSRQGVAQAAFVIALAAGLGIGVMIQSFRDSVVDWLGQVLWAEHYISVPNGASNSPLTAERLAQLRMVDGVIRAGGVRTSRRQAEDGTWYNLNAYALDMESLRRFPLFSGHMEQAYERWQAGEGWFVNEALARLRGIEVGDVIALQAGSDLVRLPVLAINADYSADEGALVMAWPHYARRFHDPNLDAMGLVTADGQQWPPIRERVEALLPPETAVRWVSQQGIYQRSLEVFDQTFSVTHAGRWLILLIALVAVAGAMVAMVMAQRPWLGTLRALGVTPAGLMLVIVEQGLILGFIAAGLALPLGIGVSWVLAQDIMRVSFGWLLPVQLQWAPMGFIFVQSFIVVLVASVYPAWRWRHENLRQGGGR